MSEIIDNLDPEEYHARPELGSTSIKTLAQNPPAVFKHRMDHPEPPKTAYDIGRVAHSVIIEGSWDSVEVIDVDSKRGKAWSDPASAAREAGKTPLTAAEALTISDMARAVKEHPIASELFTGHQAEVSYFTERDGVPVKARADAVKGDTVIDLKTTGTGVSDLGRTVHNFGYHIQEAHYRAVIEACGQTVKDFVFVFVTTTAPHLVRVIRLDDDAVDLGDAQAARALAVYKECTSTGNWPGYAGIDTIDLPGWAYWEDENEETEMKI